MLSASRQSLAKAALAEALDVVQLRVKLRAGVMLKALKPSLSRDPLRSRQSSVTLAVAVGTPFAKWTIITARSSTKAVEPRSLIDRHANANGRCGESKSVAHAQRFLSVHGLVRNLFRVGRHLLRAVHHRVLRTGSFRVWNDVTGIC